MSRTQSKLEACAKEVQEAGIKAGKKTKTRIVANDWTKNFDGEAHKKMYDQHLKDLDISILCNNVGMATMGNFTEISPETVHNAITCNVYSTALMTHQVIQSFKRRHQ